MRSNYCSGVSIADRLSGGSGELEKCTGSLHRGSHVLRRVEVSLELDLMTEPFLILRMYQPGERIHQGAYTVPAVVKAN